MHTGIQLSTGPVSFIECTLTLLNFKTDCKGSRKLEMRDEAHKTDGLTSLHKSDKTQSRACILCCARWSLLFVPVRILSSSLVFHWAG